LLADLAKRKRMLFASMAEDQSEALAALLQTGHTSPPCDKGFVTK
jgi:hypothetical protein